LKVLWHVKNAVIRFSGRHRSRETGDAIARYGYFSCSPSFIIVASSCRAFIYRS
jgi:hypothetical protein